METVRETRNPDRVLSATAKGGANQAPPSSWRAVVARTAKVVAIGLSVAALVAVIRYGADVLDRSPAVSVAEYVYVPDSRFLRIASLGHAVAVADILWFRTISYFGAHYRGDRLYPWLAKMCDVVTDLDPRALHVYRFGAVVLAWEANLPDQGIALLDKGLRHLPDSWLLHYLQGMSYYFFKDDLQGAAVHLRRAAELPGAHPYVSRLAAVMYAEGFGTQTAESFLQQLAANTPDPDMRRIITDRLGELTLAQHLDALNDAQRRYRERVGQAAASPEVLLRDRFIAKIPDEPFGGNYILDPETGEARTTSGHSPLRLYRSKTRDAYHKRGTLPQ